MTRDVNLWTAQRLLNIGCSIKPTEAGWCRVVFPDGLLGITDSTLERAVLAAIEHFEPTPPQEPK